MNSDSDLDIDKIRTRMERASEGYAPWRVDREGDGTGLDKGVCEPVIRSNSGKCLARVEEFGPPYRITEFIAHARQDIPALCDEVERLREVIEVLRDYMKGRGASAKKRVEEASDIGEKRFDRGESVAYTDMLDLLNGLLEEGDE